jgi:intraflagellar transport protein 46
LGGQDEPDDPASGRISPAESPSSAVGGTAQPQVQTLARKDASDDSSSTSSEDSEPDSPGAKATPGQYDPNEYANLKVNSEVKELFGYITRYKPHTVDLETQLKAFVPDFVPAVGEVDGFIKVPRPDGKESTLGLSRLDEPCLNASDPTVLDLQLRSISKANYGEADVKGIDNAEKNPKEIANWIARIEDLHRMKPPPTVHYAKRMPDIEQLMQVWPTEFEEYIKTNDLPDLAQLDLPLKDFVKMTGALLDIPMQGECVDTLHVIFTLYAEFKNNPHFALQAGQPIGGEEDMPEVKDWA